MPTKGELSKENMFRKIIPSAKRDAPEMQGTQGAVQVAPVVPPVTAQEETVPPPTVLAPVAQEMSPPAAVNVPQVPAAVLPPVEEKMVLEKPEIPPLQAVEMPAENNEPAPYPLNLAELLVEKNYERFRVKMDGCACERCRDDVFAITLNSVSPQYVVSNHTDDIREDARELTTEVVTAMMKALFLVKKSPRHE